MRANSGLSQLPSGLWVPDDYAPRVPLSPTVRAVRAVRGALPGDSIEVTPGSGAIVATHTVNSKEYQVVMVADGEGHINDSRPEYSAWFTPATNSANRSWADLFNADATAVVRVRGIWVVPTVTAITGVNIGFDINKTSAVGTGGTTITPRRYDSSAAALDADITARAGATGGATLDHLFWAGYHFNEETNAATPLLQHQNQIPSGIGSRVAEIVLRQDQGLQVKQHGAGTVGLTGVLMYFVVDN